tara:strand:+ start:10322 stop:12115 length:1794 start_codon:yes stop_codon:yes gene_type:complete
MQTGYIEIALRNPMSRGLLFSLDKLEETVAVYGKNFPVYRSVYVYDEEGYDFIKKHKSVKGYNGYRSIDYVPIDIDMVDKSGDKTLEKAHNVYDLLRKHLDAESICVFFSGTGFHFDVSANVFGFENHSGNNLPYIVKNTMMKLIPSADMSVYSRSALYRCSGSKNFKSGLYKTYISEEQFFGMSYKAISNLGKRWDRNDIYTYPSDDQSGKLENFVSFDSPNVKAFNNVTVSSNVVPCVQDMYNNEPQKGQRHITSMRIISHFKRNGIPLNATKAAMFHWNKNNGLSESALLTNINDVYTKGYQYGCMDNIMMQYCQPNCIHFKRKDYLMDIFNVDDLQALLNNRMEKDFSGVSINLSKLYGLVGTESIIYPGELVTIVGPTGCNKTTLAQNIALSYNAANDTIDKEMQIPTLYLSLELAPWLMHRRNIQIVSNTKSEDMKKDSLRTLYDVHRDKLDHLMLQTVSPTIEDIRKKIREISPACIIIDYIDLVEPPKHTRGEYESLRHISHALSNLAVNYDMIIIQLSQTSREYARSGILDIYSGKGSGAIENASRKLMVLEGDSKTRQRRLKMVKSTDGELWEVPLEFKDSFRLKRI